jgi:hypothetical protein
MQTSNSPTQQKLHLIAAHPEKYTLRVADRTNYGLPNDGRVISQIPALPPHSSLYLFGTVKIKDGSAHRASARPY